MQYKPVFISNVNDKTKTLIGRHISRESHGVSFVDSSNKYGRHMSQECTVFNIDGTAGSDQGFSYIELLCYSMPMCTNNHSNGTFRDMSDFSL